MRGLLARTATVALAVAGVVSAATSADWRKQSIYQLLTDRFAREDGSTSATCNPADGQYCGGSWKGIVKQLDYIQDMGFTAIWISPITLNIEAQTPYGWPYHGYWQTDLYQLNSHFGTADDLKALSSEVHSRGMYLMVDIVVNHFGFDGPSSSVDYSKFVPFNDKKYFHNYCTIDYNNQTSIEQCWLGDSKVELPDVKTDDSTVKSMYSTWIEQLVSNYSIDGLRIDTVKHVQQDFWGPFQKAAGVFATGEVLSGDASYVCGYQKAGLDSLLNYPLYFSMIEYLNNTNASPKTFKDELSALKNACSDVTVLGVFSENHDNPRFASMTQDLALAKNLLSLTVLSDGVPIIYAGQEQHYSGNGDPYNREATWLSGYNTNAELYKTVQALNQVRNTALYTDGTFATTNAVSIYDDAHTIAMKKGSVISVITNLGANAGSSSITLTNTSLASGVELIEALTCQTFKVGPNGLVVPLSGGVPRIYFPLASAQGSGICSLNTNATSAGTTTAGAAATTLATSSSSAGVSAAAEVPESAAASSVVTSSASASLTSAPAAYAAASSSSTSSSTTIHPQAAVYGYRYKYPPPAAVRRNARDRRMVAH